MFLESFGQYEHILETLFETKKNNFHCFYSGTCFCCHHETLKNNDHSFLCRNRELSLIWFWLLSVLKERHKHNSSLRKQELCKRNISWQTRNLRKAPKGCIRFHWNCKRTEVEAKKMSNCEIYFLASEITLLHFKVISQYGHK